MVNLDSILDKYKKEVKFIQVGANDGKTGDPVYDRAVKNKWKGLLIEPLPIVFEALKQNYEDSDMIFENVAIHSTRIKVLIYTMGSCSSIYKENVNIKTELSKENSRVREIKCSACTLDHLIKKYSFFNFDLLQIDVEGAELEVIRSLSLNRYRPIFINYEHKHIRTLGMETEFLDIMKKNRYTVFEYSARDSIAVSEDYSL